MSMLSIETPGFSVKIQEDTTEKLLEVLAEVRCWHLEVKAAPIEEPGKHKAKAKAKTKAELAHEAKLAIMAEVEAAQGLPEAGPIDARAVLPDGGEMEDNAPGETLGGEGAVVLPVEEGHASVACSNPASEPTLEGAAQMRVAVAEGVGTEATVAQEKVLPAETVPVTLDQYFFPGSTYRERKSHFSTFLNLVHGSGEELSARNLGETCNALADRIGLRSVRGLISQYGESIAGMTEPQRAELYARIYAELRP